MNPRQLCYPLRPPSCPHHPVDQATYNPFEPGFIDDPYDQYARIRQGGRTRSTVFGALVLHRYEDCSAALRVPGTSVDYRNLDAPWLSQLPRDLVAEREQWGRNDILHLDPPDHTRIRRLVASAFTVRRLEELRPRVQRHVQLLLDGLVAAAHDGEPVDLIARFAYPLPFQVISELLGMPEGDRDQLRACSRTVTRALEPFQDKATRQAILAASDSMHAHVRSAIRWKRASPADDLLTALVNAEEDGDKLSTAELTDQVTLLYLAGHETTVNLIGNGTLALLQHRDQLERLAADPSLDANAVDELLRWDSPVQITRRIALTEFEAGGETVRPGQLVSFLLGAANRDPEHWGPTADRLDLERQGAGAHLAFGGGIHYCLGAALARMEGAEAVGALIRRFPRMELATEAPVWNRRVVLRGLESLPVALETSQS